MTFRTESEARAFLAQIWSADAKSAPLVVATTHGQWTFSTRWRLKKPPEICSICGEPFVEYSNNAWPVNNGRCCAYCDDHVVTPARIALAEVPR